MTTCRKARSSRASSRTSPTTARSSTSAASTACCTSPTWRGSACKHPSEVVKVGDELEVRILKFDRERNRVSLGPEAARRGSVGGHRAPLSARHARVRQGHQHRRLRLLRRRSRTASKAWCTSPRWTGPTRTSIRPRSCRSATKSKSWCSTSTKSAAASRSASSSAQPNPWEEFAANHKKGDKVSGQIKSITDFGIFIGLAGGIDGLVHLSDISWDVPGEEAVRNYKKGEQLEAMVLRSIRSASASRSASSSSTRIRSRPVSCRASEGQHRQGRGEGSRRARARSSTSATASKASCARPRSARDRVEDARTVLKVGDEVEAKFTGIDRKTRTISLSIKAKEVHEEAAGAAELPDRRGATVDGHELGDLLKEQIELPERESSRTGARAIEGRPYAMTKVGTDRNHRRASRSTCPPRTSSSRSSRFSRS